MTSIVIVAPVVYMTAVFHDPPGPKLVWQLNRYATIEQCELEKERIWAKKKLFQNAKLTCDVKYE